MMERLDPAAVFPVQMRDVQAYSGLVYSRGLVSAKGGNISARCGGQFLITATDAPLRAIDSSCAVLCSADGTPLPGQEGVRPSKETPFHQSIYRCRPDVNFVIHAHPCSCIAQTLMEAELPMLTVSARMKLGHVPTIPEARPGTAELADQVEQAVRGNPECCAFLMKAHGALVMGRSAEDCYCLLELLEDTAKIALLTWPARHGM